MGNFPSLQERTVPFRGGAKSETYNKTVQEVFYDLNNVFNVVGDLEDALEETQSIHTTQNAFQQMRIDELMAQVASLEDQLQVTTPGTYQTVIHANPAEMQADPTADDSEKIAIDAQYGLATLPISGDMTSKVYVFDPVSTRVFQPKSLDVELDTAADGQAIAETDPMRAFDGNENTYWHRRYYFPYNDATDSVTAVMTVTLPDDIISSRDVNMLYLNPFPLNTLTVEKIEYKLNGNWTLLPGFPTDVLGNPIPYTNAGFLKFHFQSVPMGQVRITLQQSHWIHENNQKVFHIGLQEVGIFYAGYQTNVGRLQFPLILKGKKNNHMITSIVPEFENEGALSDKSSAKGDLFSYVVYQMDAQGNLSYTRDSLPIVLSSDTIMIKANLFRDPYTQATPALKSITVQYQDA